MIPLHKGRIKIPSRQQDSNNSVLHGLVGPHKTEKEKRDVHTSHPLPLILGVLRTGGGSSGSNFVIQHIGMYAEGNCNCEFSFQVATKGPPQV
jgi:hypothetical protein